MMHHSLFYTIFRLFEKLGKSDNMPAFTRLVSMSAYREENLQWFKDNPGKLEALDSWIKSTKREP